MKKSFLFYNNLDSSWGLGKRTAYYIYRVVLLLCTGFSMGMLLLILALGPYAEKSFTRFALPEYFTQWDIVLFNAVPIAIVVVLCYFITARVWAGFLLGGGVFL